MCPLNKWNPTKAIFTPLEINCRRRTADISGILSLTGFTSAFLISISLIGIIFIFLIKDSFPIFQRDGLRFLTGQDWYAGEVYGALPMIYGTVIVTFIAMCLALPLGLGSAIITSEVLSGRARLITKMAMELLAGIPGVVYGLLGIVILTTAVKDIFGLIDGNCIFAAGILLGVMILPTIMTLSEDALRAVPIEYREQALALGLGRSETIIHAVLPQALKGIIAAILLGISRAMGETIAVMLVIGSLDRIPHPFYNIFTTAQTITSKLGREAQEALGVGYHWNALIALGLILFLMAMVVTFIGDVIIVRPVRDKRQTAYAISNGAHPAKSGISSIPGKRKVWQGA